LNDFATPETEFSAVTRDVIALDLVELMKEGRKRGLSDPAITASFVAVLVHCAVEIGRPYFDRDDLQRLCDQVYGGTPTAWAQNGHAA